MMMNFLFNAKKNKQFFLSVILIFIFFGIGEQKILAAENIEKWTWSGNNDCWHDTAQYKKSITFTITADMLTNGKFLAEATGYSKNGHTFMYFDAENELGAVLKNNECYTDGEPVPAAGKMVFHTFDKKGEKATPSSVKHDFGALAIGSKHTISCWGFANNNSGGEGDCSFGLEPSCTLKTDPNPANMLIGDSSKLIWETKNTINATIDNDITGPLNLPDGNITVASSTSGVNWYIMTVRGAVTTKTCQAVITVNQPSCSFAAEPSSIAYGNKSKLKWETNGVTSAKIDNDGDNNSDKRNIEEKELKSGSIEVGPLIKTTYTMIAYGKNGPVVCPSAIIDVTAAPVKNNGFIPCARLTDNLSTPEINETAPCNICSAFYMLKSVINFIMSMSVGIGVFIFVLVGLIYIFSGGSLERITLAKTNINSVISGISIIFVTWVAIAIILQLMGYSNMSKWNQVSCGIMATPSQVNNLAVTVGDDKNIVSWSVPTVNANINHYHVYKSTNAGFIPDSSNLVSDNNVGVTDTNPTYTFIDTGLTNGAVYYYKVLAVNDIGEGSQSSEVSTMADCKAGNTNVHQNRIVATDADHDGYSTAPASQQCVGVAKEISSRTYYKNPAGDYNFIESAAMLGNSDCADDNPDIWRNRYLDSDNDNYCTTPKDAPICVGSDSKYPNYKDSCSCFTDAIKDVAEAGNSACYYRDCNPSDNTRWRNRYFDYDGDNYGDEFLNIYGTDKATKNLGPLFCVGDHSKYVDIAPDCKPNNKWIYQLKSVVNDTDQDGYTITDKDRYGKTISPLLIPVDPELIPVAPMPVKIGDKDILFVPGCVGDLVNPLIKNTNNQDRKYYRNEKEPAVGGGFFYVDSGAGNWLNKGGETDCDPKNTNIYHMKDVATDIDHDGYSVTVVSEVCVGDYKNIGGKIYYKKTAGSADSDFIYIDKTSIPVGGVNTDCDDNNANIYRLKDAAIDADHDGYSSTTVSNQCVGESKAFKGRIYYKKTVGSADSDFIYIDRTSIKAGGVNTDCDDNITNIYQTLNVTTDSDHDNYSLLTVSATSMCVGDVAAYSGRTYYKNSTGAYPFMLSVPAGIDCNDGTDAKWRNRYTDKDDDKYCASNIQTCVGNETGYRDNCNSFTDCNDNDAALYNNLAYYCDKDGDKVRSKSSLSACMASAPQGCDSAAGSDCDDGDPNIKPGAAEVCDNKDNDCDGNIDGITQNCIGDACSVPGNQTCTAGSWGVCSTANTCTYSPACGSLSKTSDCGYNGSVTGTRTTNCCGGCSAWVWGKCIEE